MLHPFQEGKTYRNRIGQYVVQSIDGDEMTIRYVNGGIVKTRASIQARIWENIQFEEQMTRERERRQLAQEARQAARRRSARARRAKAKPKFTGFEASDFEPKKRGISWGNREEMGKFLAYELTHRAEGEFGSWIVPRQSAVHIARTEHYDRDTRERNTAFVVAADEKGVTYGLWLGKPAGEIKPDWHITTFLAILDEDEKPRRDLRTVMKEDDLSLDVYALDVSYGQVGKIEVQDRGLLWQHETADQETTRRMNWKDLADYVREVASGKQFDMYLRGHLSVEDALEAGAGVSEQIAKVLEDLVPIYDFIVGS
jgi:hypothetical protein